MRARETVVRWTRPSDEGRQAKDVARIVLEQCGFEAIRSGVRPPGSGLELSFVATDRTGADWAFDLSGTFTSARSGLARADSLWKALATAAVLQHGTRPQPLVLLTTDLPRRGESGALALGSVVGPDRLVIDVVGLLDPEGHDRLTAYARFGLPATSGWA